MNVLELEPLRNVGVALSQATLQELAYSLGIEKTVAEMTEAEKAQLRYIQIMKSSVDWQADMGKTLTTPANMLRVIKQQFTLLGRAIGNVFIPIIMVAIPYVMALTDILTTLANKLAEIVGNILGVKVDFGDSMGSFGDIMTGLEGIGKEAEETTNKLNTMLAPFDELNVVQSKSQGAGSGISGVGGDLGVDLPTYDALAKLTDTFKNNIATAKENLDKILDVASLIGLTFASWKISSSIMSFLKEWNLIDKKNFGATIGLTLFIAGVALIFKGTQDLNNPKTFWKGVLEKLAGTIGIGSGTYMLTKNIGITLYVTGISLLLQGIHDVKNLDNMWLGIGEELGGVASLAGGTFMLTKSVLITLAVTAVATTFAAGSSLKDLIDLEPTAEELWYAVGIEGLFPNVSEWLSENILTPVFVDLPNTVNGIFENIKRESPRIWDETWVAIGNTFDTETENAKKNWDTFKLDTKTAFDILKTQISTDWDSIWVNIGNKFDTGKDNIKTKWDEFKTNVSDTFDDVKETITTKWDSAKDWLKNNIGDKEYWKTKFNGLFDGASGVLSELKSKFENWTAKIKTPHISWQADGMQAKGTVKSILEALGLPTSIPKLKVDWYEQGGFPESGELFFANENGVPEMIGRIGNRTAVANNDQITTSLTNALTTALSGMSTNSKSPTTIYIGNRKVYEGYGDYIADENDRYGTNMIRI